MCIYIYGLRGLLTVQDMKTAWRLAKTICRMFGHLPLHSIQLVLNCEAHKHGHHNTPGQCHHWLYSEIFLLLGMRILKNLTLTVCNGCIITWPDVQKQGSLDVKKRSQPHFTSNCSWHEIIVGMPPLHACWFSCGFKMMTPHLIAQQDLWHMHHLQYGISTNVPTITNRQHSLCMLSVGVYVCARARTCTCRHGTQWVHNLW